MWCLPHKYYTGARHGENAEQLIADRIFDISSCGINTMKIPESTDETFRRVPRGGRSCWGFGEAAAL